MILTDEIARFIEEMLSESGGRIEICRNDLAGKIGCVPSQINYVITSRFTADRGYIIESRRGGGGYIRIIKKQFHKNEYLMHFIQAVGDKIGSEAGAVFVNNLFDNGVLTQREAAIITAALSEIDSDNIRAAVLRNISLTLMH